jgi:hypothetical protein
MNKTQSKVRGTKNKSAVESILRAYRPPMTEDGSLSAGKPYLIAHFLHWAYMNHPGKPFLHQEVAMAIGRLATVPGKDSHEAKAIRSSMNRAKQILLSEYGLGSTCDPKLGHRACTSSEETVLRDLTPRIRRHHHSEQRIHDIINRAVKQNELSAASQTLVKRVRQIIKPELTGDILKENAKLLMS